MIIGAKNLDNADYLSKLGERLVKELKKSINHADMMNEAAGCQEKEGQERMRKALLSLQTFMSDTVGNHYNNIYGNAIQIDPREKSPGRSCARESGLRMDVGEDGPSDLQTLRKVVISECRTALAKNGPMEIAITEERSSFVVSCEILLPEIQTPALILRVQKGDSSSSAITYGFGTPPYGWNATLENMRGKFIRDTHDTVGRRESGLAVGFFFDSWVGATGEAVKDGW